MPARHDGGALGGGAPRVVWLTSESDPRLVSARSVAADLAREARPAHLVWNPGSGEVVQQVPIVRAARALTGRAGREGRICAQIMVVGQAREPFTTGLLTGLEEIMRWLDAWGVPRRWPAGPPLPSPQSYHSGRSRRDWARGGHYGGSQVPDTSRPDPGAIDIHRVTGPDALIAAVPHPRPVPGPETAPGLPPVSTRIAARRPGEPVPAPLHAAEPLRSAEALRGSDPARTPDPLHRSGHTRTDPESLPAMVAHVAMVASAEAAAGTVGRVPGPAGCDDVPATPTPAPAAAPLPGPGRSSPAAVPSAPEPASMRS
ncbi:hypothetical protein ABZ801_27730 [Actinomadura sp. NPDC047616]|uniref:hypothetical protein n=1 Tax=Actinomadura sp. NPDC047616 TaxID=3155914 RepID=UPI0033C1D696